VSIASAKERTPARPGPGPMSDAMLRAFDISIGRRVTGLLQGDYRSSALGSGTELAQMRKYEPGDDVRRIDWNVTARMNDAHVRVDVGERVLTTWLVMDVSPSMTFGTADRRKVDVAEGVALATGHVATRRGNRLGAITFGGAKDELVPPAQGRPGLMALLRLLHDEPAPRNSGGSTLGSALGQVVRFGGWSRLIVIVSDFRGPRDWRGQLVELSGRHEVICVEIRDPREQELPNIGDLWLVDPETGRHLRVDTSRRAIRERFAAAATKERAEVAEMIATTGARHVTLTTQGDWLRPFMGAVGRRRGVLR
jgi:uncharacterized protein (DUF58 family)